MKRCVIHIMHADDDIIQSLGWTGVQCYIAIDPDLHDGDGDAICADLSEVVVSDFVENLGYVIVDMEEVYDYDTTQNDWVRKDNLIRYNNKPVIRACDLRVGDTFYEDEDEDEQITVAELVAWGDNTLVHGTDGSRSSWGNVTVVRLVSRRRTA